MIITDPFEPDVRAINEEAELVFPIVLMRLFGDEWEHVKIIRWISAAQWLAEDHHEDDE